VKSNKKTFCAGAWFQLRNQQNGEYRPCCEIEPSKTQFEGKVQYAWPENQPSEYLDSPYLQYLREKMNEGIRIPECQKCWIKEDNDIVSLRQILNNTVTNNLASQIDNTWLDSYFDRKTDFHHDILLSADIKVSNVCNFSCMMCSPTDSTQIYSIWTQNVNHPMVRDVLKVEPQYLINIKQNYQSKSNYDLLAAILDRSPRHVKILGGEPLLDSKMLDILKGLPTQKKSRISLMFTTNGSINLREFHKQLVDYKQINYVVSLDGTQLVQDYVRRGSTWSLIEKNIDDWNQDHRPVDVHCTVQCLNILHVPELLDWCDDRKIKITFGLVEKPDYLSLSALPDVLKQIIAKRIGCRHKGLADILNSYVHDPLLVSKLRDFLDWYDPENHWRGIFPEWREFLIDSFSNHRIG